MFATRRTRYFAPTIGVHLSAGGPAHAAAHPTRAATVPPHPSKINRCATAILPAHIHQDPDNLRQFTGIAAAARDGFFISRGNCINCCPGVYRVRRGPWSRVIRSSRARNPCRSILEGQCRSWTRILSVYAAVTAAHLL